MTKIGLVMVMFIGSPTVGSSMQMEYVRLLSCGMTELFYRSSDFPCVARVVKVPIARSTVKLIPALGQRECVSAIARRTGAYIAINGGNYRRGGNYNGNRVNLMYLNSCLYADIGGVRASFCWQHAPRIASIDMIYADHHLMVGGRKYPVTAVNQPRAAGQAVLYTHNADPALMIFRPGAVMIVDATGTIGTINANHGAIPQGGFAYEADMLPAEIAVGMPATYSCTIRGGRSDNLYNAFDFVVGGAGLLVKDGQDVSPHLYAELSQGGPIVHCSDEIAADFYSRAQQEELVALRHPRTALGVTRSGELCIVVVDGRQKSSEGMSLPELAQFMVQLDCVDALNMGGGGCSTLCIDGAVVNIPSGSRGYGDIGQERPVSEALCIWAS